jgi:hypothetical protein
MDRLMTRRILVCATLLFALAPALTAQKPGWRQATDAELAALLPARAPVEKEHIETEMRTASGITDGKGHFVAGVVLITAGYSADGKYSHYMVVQSPLRVGGVRLSPGEYLLGWDRDHDKNRLNVRFSEAASGRVVATAEAHELTGRVGVASLRIWPPGDKTIIQIGRFGISYELGEE